MNFNVKQRLNALYTKMQQSPKLTLSAAVTVSSLGLFSIGTGGLMGTITPALLIGSTIYAALTFFSFINRNLFPFFRKKTHQTISEETPHADTNTMQASPLPTEKLSEISSVEINKDAQIKSLTSENNALQMLVNGYEEEIQKNRDANSQLKKENESLRMKNQEQSLELLSLMSKEIDLLDQIRNFNAELEKLNDKNMSLQTENTHLNVENKTHKKNIKALQAVNNSFHARLNQIKQLGEEHNQFINNLGSQQPTSPQAILNAYHPAKILSPSQTSDHTENSSKKPSLYPKLP